MTVVPNRDLMIQRLHETFRDPAVAAEAWATLDRQKGDPTIQCAIIYLSEGNLWRVRELIKVAIKGDYRQVIYEAMYTETVRRSRLAQRANPTRGWGMLRLSPKKAAKQAKAAESLRKQDAFRWSNWLLNGQRPL